MSRPSDPVLALTFPTEQETIITRAFAAPRQLVFAAMTQPEHVRQWYGLKALTMTVCEIDLRVGGKWRYVLQAPDGSEFAFSGEYHEIVAPKRLVSTERFEAIPGSDYLVTVTLAEHNGQTTLISHLRYQSRAHREGHIQAGMEAGMRETFMQLDAHLVEMMTAQRGLVMMRTFDAPRELVFQAWTDARHVDHWWGPNGFRNETFEMDVRPGGRWRYVMHGPDGADYGNRVVYHEVVVPERLVYTHGSDIDDDPDAFAVTVTFEAQGSQTQVTMRSLFPNTERRDAVVAFGAVEGGKQTLARLAEYLLKLA